MAKETFYFSHDYGARNDPKLQKVLMKLGQQGKGVYWDLIEMLYEQNGYLTIADIELYAFTLRTTTECIESLINDFDLFSKNDDSFWSDSVLQRLELREEKRQVKKSNGQKGGRPKKETEQEPKENLNETEKKPIGFSEETKGFENETEKNQSKVKERKGKESKGNIITHHTTENFSEEVPEKNSEEKLSDTDPLKDHKIYGEYSRIYLTDEDFLGLETYQAMGNKKAKELIKVLDTRIETGKENDHIKRGFGHLARLKELFDFERKFPQKFKDMSGVDKNESSKRYSGQNKPPEPASIEESHFGKRAAELKAKGITLRGFQAG